jgi:hypothetical protein
VEGRRRGNETGNRPDQGREGAQVQIDNRMQKGNKIKNKRLSTRKNQSREVVEGWWGTGTGVQVVE